MNSKTSVALGMFDGVHKGHIEVIKSALSQEHLQPAVFTFRVLQNNKECILPYKTKFDTLRAAGIQSIYSSDFEGVRHLSPEEFVRQILIERMDCAHVSCGQSFRFAKDAKADCDDLKRICSTHGIEVNVVQPVSVAGEVVSSTRIRKAIKDGNISLANEMLGRELTYELEVVEGAKLGRTLGAPTINQIIPSDCVLPKFGVYKSQVVVDVIRYTAVTNIGIKPTVTSADSPIVETYIPGFNMEIYGQTVKVSLLDFIREERKFSSVDELKEQIQIDVREACGVKQGLQ